MGPVIYQDLVIITNAIVKHIITLALLCFSITKFNRMRVDERAQRKVGEDEEKTKNFNGFSILVSTVCMVITPDDFEEM